jgi:hypothetical protein
MRKIIPVLICAALAYGSCTNDKTESDGSSAATVASTDKTKPAMELLDMSAADVVKNSFAAFSKGDIEGMTASYDDNIRYTWSGGDSLIGKKAVQDYWKARWTLIDSLTFSEHIVLPVQINESQSKFAPTGKWVLIWMMSQPKYKNGKSLNFWTHSVNHLNDAGKVDFIGMYYDRAPINKATEGLALPK